MTEVFERFNIKRVSPSALKAYASQDRGIWFVKHVARAASEDAGPAAWRGHAADAGINAFLAGADAAGALEVAQRDYELRSEEWSTAHEGEVHPDYDGERAKMLLCVERGMDAFALEDALREAGRPASYQQSCEVWLPGAPVPVGGTWDWGFGQIGSGFSLDLKSCNKLPSKPKADEDDPEADQRVAIDTDHAIQFSIYAAARKEKIARGLYVCTKEYKTQPKKGETRRLHQLVTLNEDDIAFYTKAVVQTLISMKELLTAAVAMSEYELTTPQAALARLCRPNLFARGGGYYDVWKPDFTREAAEAVPEWGLY